MENADIQDKSPRDYVLETIHEEYEEYSSVLE